MDKKPKLLIVSPSRDQGWWSGGKVLAPPPVLPLLAGLTPPEIDVQLVDENVEPTDTNAEIDWAAISCMTASAPRAYAIADAFRKRKIPVVMGGIHTTVMPDEAALHADALVIGEAELFWPEVLADLGRGRLKKRYQVTGKYCDMKGMPIPRRDLLQSGRYLTKNLVQTARGCPHACTFCSVSAVAGKCFRFRPVSEVIAEIEALKKGWVGIVDDNIVGKPSRAMELFEALIPLKKRWVGQADLRIANDPELLKLAVRSGCQALFIGLESVDPKNLAATSKKPNIGTDMTEAIAKIHRAGIEIVGSFVLGLDEDNKSVFAKTLEFAERQKLAAGQFSVLTPFPGTAMREQLEQEGRVLPYGWDHYTMSNVVFLPKHMSPEELHQGRQWVYQSFYSPSSIFRRCLTLHGKLPTRIVKPLVNISYGRIGRRKGLSWGLPSS